MAPAHRPLSLAVDGILLPLRLRRSARARRMTLRLTPNGQGAVVVAPPGVPEGAVLRFAADNRAWLGARLAALPPRVPLLPGAEVPLLGVPHRLAHRPEERRGVWAEAGEIRVCGQGEHFSRRVADWLRAEAGRAIRPRADDAARRLGRRMARLRIGDPRSRWGSCTAAGNLAFSWRLVLAPPAVLDYVVAHEAAHLVAMNHGPAFWATVEALVGDWRAARAWLRRHGPGLHRYG